MRIRTTLKRFFIVLLFLLLIAGIGVGVYIYINKPETITDFLKSNETKEEDFKNGIYSYERLLDKSYRVFDGCNVYAIYNYLAVMGDTYKYYESSCLKTSLIKSGKVDELEFSLNKDNKYEVKYDDKVLEKDGKITSIIVSEDISSKFRSSNFEAIEFVIKEAEKEGSYFNFETAIAGSVSNYKFYFSYLEDVIVSFLYKDICKVFLLTTNISPSTLPSTFIILSKPFSFLSKCPCTGICLISGVDVNFTPPSLKPSSLPFNCVIRVSMLVKSNFP